MNNTFLDIAVKIAACVCGKDGIISEIEEKKIFELIVRENNDFSIIDFNKSIDEFFDSHDQIENYLGHIRSETDKDFIIQLCEQSASADGLDIKENIALDKVKVILGHKS